jgi:hypothetical protein
MAAIALERAMSRIVKTTLLCTLALVVAACDNTDKPTTSKQPSVARPAPSTPVATSSSERPPSLVDLWVDKAIASQGPVAVDVLGKIKEKSASVPVVRVGTLESWSNEITMDDFATRAARLMNAMSFQTGSTYCGQVCKAPGAQGGPWSIDILTMNQVNRCAAVPVCSLPNGSGLKHYGEPNGTIILVNHDPSKISASGTSLYGNTYDAQTFSLTTADGQMLEMPKAKSDYYVFGNQTLLTFNQQDIPTRTVYDFAEEFSGRKPRPVGAKFGKRPAGMPAATPPGQRPPPLARKPTGK